MNIVELSNNKCTANWYFKGLPTQLSWSSPKMMKVQKQQELRAQLEDKSENHI
jgi:hypothetical protein